MKHNDIQIIGVPEEEEREQGIENLDEERMTENVPNLANEIDVQVQAALRISDKKNSNRPTPRHIVIKVPKVKDRESEKQQAKGS